MTVGAGFQELWPTPIGVHRYPDAATLNPCWSSCSAQGRAVQERKRGAERKAFFASDDDLLHRVKIPEWQDFVRFLVTSLGETAKQANREAWAGQELELKVGIEGMWFQCSRNGAFHDVHTHGNCSWSSAYIVQIDDSEQRVTHPVYGAANGVTRLYGPPFTALGRRLGRRRQRVPHAAAPGHRADPGAAAAVSVLAGASGAALRRREGADHHLLQRQHPRLARATSCTATARTDARGGLCDRRPSRRLTPRRTWRRLRPARCRGSGGLVGIGEVAARADGRRVLGAEDALEVGDERLEDRDRVLRAPGVLVDGGRLLRVLSVVGVLGAEDPLEVGDERLERRDRVVGAPGVLLGDGEAAAGAQRVGVLGAEARSRSASSGS